jgi:NAD(P)-dependent dehydrogenase (short-subunit alcohol dehydrogenase family)
MLGRVALVTGAGSGIGLATALLLARRGCDLIINDIDRGAAEAAAEAVGSAGRRAHVAAFDVSDVEAVERAVADAEHAVGRIDVLVNNAGVSSVKHRIEDIDEADFDRMFGVHVKGAFFTTRCVVAGMKRRHYGRIVNVASNWALAGADFLSHYCGAKAALIGLTRAWAREFAPFGIYVNTMVPGTTITPMITARLSAEEIGRQESAALLGRWARPEEIAHAIAFLASDDASATTGQLLVANCGQNIV